MTRRYTQGRRAEQAAETRRRIVETAIALHGTVGPARTNMSMIAERAGVQRHTLYAHFPDERSMLLACSGHELERDPPPSAESWQKLPQGQARLRAGLDAIYAWYARNAGIAACVLRDSEFHAPTREVVALRWGPAVARWHDVLGAGLAPAQQALLRVMIGFPAWRSLVQESGLAQADAAALAAAAIATA